VEYTQWFFRAITRSFFFPFFGFSFSADIELAKTKQIEAASHLPS